MMCLSGTVSRLDFFPISKFKKKKKKKKWFFSQKHTNKRKNLPLLPPLFVFLAWESYLHVCVEKNKQKKPRGRENLQQKKSNNNVVTTTTTKKW